MDIIAQLREYKISGFTLFDTALAFLAVLLLSPLLTRLFKKVGLVIPTASWLLFVIPMSIIGHALAGADTPLLEAFLDPNGGYLIKIVVVGLFIAGCCLIRRTKPDGQGEKLSQ